MHKINYSLCPVCFSTPRLSAYTLKGNELCYFVKCSCGARGYSSSKTDVARRLWNDGKIVYSIKGRKIRFGCEYCVETVDRMGVHVETDDAYESRCQFCNQSKCPYESEFKGYKSYEKWFEECTFDFEFFQGYSDTYHLNIGDGDV